MVEMSPGFWTGIAGLAMVLLFTIPSLIGITSHLRTSKPKSGLYEDKDGAATEKSNAEYTAKIAKSFLAILSVSGLSLSIILAILDIARPDGTLFEDWLNVAQSSLIVFQTLAIALIRDPVKSYDLGLFAAFSNILLFMILLFQGGLVAHQNEGRDVGFGSPEQNVLRISHLALVVLAAWASLSIPRRPQVFHQGKPVDGMYTVSALSRYTFSWCGDLLQLSRAKNRLNLEDLAKMDHFTRSKDLSQAWAERKHTRKLWIEVFLAHKLSFIIQWILTLGQAFGNFAPQFVMYHILIFLENREFGDPVTAEAWIWVVALTLATIAAAWVESYMFWISWAELAIPIRAQLSALIFQKAMRRKDVKGAAKVSKKDIGSGPDLADASNVATAGDKAEIDAEEDTEPQGKQSTVNLIGVDTKRVSDFASFNNYFAGSLFKVLVSFTFLITIIGWKPLLCGFAAMSLTIPINIYFSKRYSAAQDRLMKVRDTKMGVVTEALQGIRQIKFSALEDNWHAKIGQVRERELGEQWSVFVNDTFLIFCWITSPIALAATSLAVYATVNGELLPSVAFTAIGVFANLEVSLAVIPELTTDLIDAWISIERIEKYLNAPDIVKNTSAGTNISFENVSIAWPSDEEKEYDDDRYVLRDINVSFPQNELSVISGKTGSGKSLLLAAILGEVDVLAGNLNVPQAPSALERHDNLANQDNWIIPQSIAFVAQIPWIENASIKDNILFGLPFNDYRYHKVIEVCALRKDLDMLPDGEKTEIGANGINLSGGQRWRVTFARALYSRAGILVLDDIFSAVDAHVGRYIFEKGLTGELGVGRTRILVTHHVALCKSKTKYLVELRDGTVENAGLVQELEAKGRLQNIISHEANEAGMQEDEDPTVVNSKDSFNGDAEPLKQVDSKSPRKFIEDEKRETGRVKTTIYMDYLRSSGGFPFWTMALVAFATLEAIMTGRQWWVRLWTGDDEQKFSVQYLAAYSHVHYFAGLSTTSTPSSSHSLTYYLSVYIILAIISALLGTARYFYIYTGSIRASRRLFDDLCFTILRTPLRWMDTVPLGRILNRFTADFNIVDSRLANDIGFGGNNFFRLLGVIVAGVFVSPWVIVLSLSLLIVCVYIARLYMSGAREAKRLESNAKSPVFEQFGSALTGVGTIRAFDKCEVYIQRMYIKIDDHSTSFWHLWIFNRWMSWRMSAVGGLFATFVAIMILLIDGIDAALAGFALSYALDYGSVVIWTIRHYTNMELDMNAAERIIEYSRLPTESLEGADPPAAWPSEGRLEVNDLVVGYAADLPPVLKGLTFSVERNERVGVVGRTGAGKSSLTLALFRFLEAREGNIHIDGIEISKIKLHALRSRLAIIPQDPVLFSGTVRTNLDAFDEHEDNELRDALQRVHLVSVSEMLSAVASATNTGGTTTPTGAMTPNAFKNTNPFTSLTSPITEGGLNLSQGQRQLLCLARAIVSRPKIMILDEATSSVDMATDALIQRSIREEFDGSTLIVIAHRLSTIADFDKILVLDDGKVCEYGSPKELFALENGVFKGLVGESGEKEKLEAIILGSSSP